MPLSRNMTTVRTFAHSVDGRMPVGGARECRAYSLGVSLVHVAIASSNRHATGCVEGLLCFYRGGNKWG